MRFSDPAIQLRLSSRRFITLGTGHPRAGEWELLQTLGSGKSTMHFEDSASIDFVAFENFRPSASMDESILPEIPYPASDRFGFRMPYFTSATMRTVTSVTPCLNGDTYTGAILQYKDGHRKALGQVRLDRLQPSFELSHNRGFWLCFTPRQGILMPKVTYMSTIYPDSNPKANMYLSRHNHVEWWWNGTQDEIIHAGKRSADIYETPEPTKPKIYKTGNGISVEGSVKEGEPLRGMRMIGQGIPRGKPM